MVVGEKERRVAARVSHGFDARRGNAWVNDGQGASKKQSIADAACKCRAAFHLAPPHGLSVPTMRLDDPHTLVQNTFRREFECVAAAAASSPPSSSSSPRKKKSNSEKRRDNFQPIFGLQTDSLHP